MTISQDLGPTSNSVTWVLTSLALIAVVLRLYLRVHERQNAGLDDLIIAISGILDLGTAIALSISVAHGTGKHVQNIPPSELPTAGHLNLVATAFAILDIVVPKLSVAILLIRVLSPRRIYAIALIASAVFAIFLGVLIVIITFVQCSPVAGQWNPEKYHPTCWSPNILVDISIFGGAYAAFIDLLFAAIPIYALWRIQMSWGKKIGVMTLMGLGVIACAVAAYKCSLLPHLAKRKDLTYESAGSLVWSLIEANIVILVACIPTLKPYTTILSSAARRRWTQHRSQSRYREFSDDSGRRSDVELAVHSKDSAGKGTGHSKTFSVGPAL